MSVQGAEKECLEAAFIRLPSGEAGGRSANLGVGGGEPGRVQILG